MTWNSTTFAEAIRLRDDFERRIRETTDEEIAGARAELYHLRWAVTFETFPGTREIAEQSTQETIRQMQVNHREAARTGALKRVALLGLSQEQREELGRYMIGTPDEGNVIDEARNS
jgi:predicted DNA-binding protein (UPF0278 family)